MYVELRRDDRLPIVAYAQWLLGQHPAVGRESLPIDGLFGPQTERAVLLAQQAESFPTTGRIAEPLWSALRRVVADQTICVESIGIGSVSPRWSVNGFDPDVLADRNHLDDHDPHTAVVIQGGASMGLPRAIDRILARPHRRCVLLRFHGHGAPGFMVVSADGTAGSAFDLHESEGYRRELARLRPLFGRFGSIELHGCRVASGDRGHRSLRMLAEEARVPVTAAYQRQMGGAFSNRFRRTRSHRLSGGDDASFVGTQPGGQPECRVASTA